MDIEGAKGMSIIRILPFASLLLVFTDCAIPADELLVVGATTATPADELRLAKATIDTGGEKSGFRPERRWQL